MLPPFRCRATRKVEFTVHLLHDSLTTRIAIKVGDPGGDRPPISVAKMTSHPKSPEDRDTPGDVGPDDPVELEAPC
jgi:hypothetical protein